MSKEWEIKAVSTPGERDLDQLAELLVEVVGQGASVGFLPPLSVEAALRYWQGVWSPNVQVWTLSEDGTIVGTVQLHRASSQNGGHRAEIAKLMVHPNARGRGYARALMHTAEEQALADGRTLLVLDTRAGDPSNSLYQSLGFLEAGRIPDYAQSADGSLHETVYYYKKLT
ncbi:GNAT family N-acetyltransferase [Tumebacillus flagellatus]|uniref:GCN5 family acetyltransferase n=1 Tax=Tumebacillus flagellatus TaxID=1157490 RepID=A0A074LW17_9BACL|nr:GNAT family N-acetyltransferase [Tumebacillus flagellatus]KEO84238.1 GCN5 family acetyltransferase [Tumebacillus flagellatus]